MNIGIFDSGLGGLFLTRAIIKQLPQYDYIYLGDTQRVPYGNRSQETIYEFTREAVEYLFKKDCGLIILACNTASAQALRKIQQEYLPAHFPDLPAQAERRVLGVIIPTLEALNALPEARRVGVLATASTAHSHAYAHELKKINPAIEVFEQSVPLLVPLIENDGLSWLEPIARSYCEPLLKKHIDTLILGCTHYSIIKDRIQTIVGQAVRVVAQDEVVPPRLADYLSRHPEIESKLSKNSTRKFLVTDLTEQFEKKAQEWFDDPIHLEHISLGTP